ncbi:MAG: hypothetical protein ACNA8W_20390 [Bradymonadaceae bacterium]
MNHGVHPDEEICYQPICRILESIHNGRILLQEDALQAKLIEVFQQSSGPPALRAVVDIIRPRKDADAAVIDARLHQFVDTIRTHPSLYEAFSKTVRETLSEARLVHAFAESGILSAAGFMHELQSRIGRRILPRHLPQNDVRLIIPIIFRKVDDWRWVARASPEAWAEVFALAEQQDSWQHPKHDLAGAIQGLAQRIGALGIDEELNAKLQEVENYDSPFLDLTIQTHEFLEHHRQGRFDHVSFEALLKTARECREIVLYLRRHKSTYGTSGRLTAVSRRLLQQIDRLKLLAHLIHPESPRDLVACSVELFCSLVEAEQTSGSITRLFQESTDLVAYQVTEQTAKKGQKYVTDSPSGYWNFLRAAFVGGLIVVPFGIIKLFLTDLGLSLAGQALLYSINYSLCFVSIYLTGSILATKQPAVTASAVARKMDEAVTEAGAIVGVADVIILIWRSQFVSFLGNLLAVLPGGFLAALIFSQWIGLPVADADKAASMLQGIHPWQSGALFYAAITGVCLFLAGITGGAVDNKVVYTDLKDRLAEHPRLAFLGGGRARLATFISENLGLISGNVALGFMLGCAGPLGIILGLPFDIRHITFSSTDFGVAAFTTPAIFTSPLWLITMGTLLGIGFLNFLVSFGITLFTGLKSRGITFGQYRVLVKILLTRFLRRPWEWFFPARRVRYTLPEDIPDEDVL